MAAYLGQYNQLAPKKKPLLKSSTPDLNMPTANNGGVQKVTNIDTPKTITTGQPLYPEQKIIDKTQFNPTTTPTSGPALTNESFDIGRDAFRALDDKRISPTQVIPEGSSDPGNVAPVQTSQNNVSDIFKPATAHDITNVDPLINPGSDSAEEDLPWDAFNPNKLGEIVDTIPESVRGKIDEEMGPPQTKPDSITDVFPIEPPVPEEPTQGGQSDLDALYGDLINQAKGSWQNIQDTQMANQSAMARRAQAQAAGLGKQFGGGGQGGMVNQAFLGGQQQLMQARTEHEKNLQNLAMSRLKDKMQKEQFEKQFGLQERGLEQQKELELQRMLTDLGISENEAKAMIAAMGGTPDGGDGGDSIWDQITDLWPDDNNNKPKSEEQRKQQEEWQKKFNEMTGRGQKDPEEEARERQKQNALMYSNLP